MTAGKLKGTIRFYGTPAEEAVGGKIYIAREGLFNDLDVCLTWHPDSKTRASVDGSQAIIERNPFSAPPPLRSGTIMENIRPGDRRPRDIPGR